MLNLIKIKARLFVKALKESNKAFLKVIAQKNTKTLEDFSNETTFLDNSIKDKDYYFSAYDKPSPVSESLDDVHQLVKSIYDNNKQPDRYFWDFYSNFFYLFQTFEAHRVEKIGFIEDYWDNDPKNAAIISLESSISTIYYFGNKCVGYLLDQGKRKTGLTDDEWICIKKYRGTRNKIIEHNLHPIGYEFTVRTHFFTASSTDSELDVDLINYSNKDYAGGFIDYYDDNYKLLEICIKYLRMLSS